MLRCMAEGSPFVSVILGGKRLVLVNVGSQLCEGERFVAAGARQLRFQQEMRAHDHDASELPGPYVVVARFLRSETSCGL